MNRPAGLQSIMASVVERRPFRIGGATVDPTSRDARWKGGEERLQPQTLKVLLALLSRRGEVVTRDELVQLCWDGRIVGDDVINRSILLLRHFADRAGGFEIETVPRAGYRLRESESAARFYPKWLSRAFGKSPAFEKRIAAGAVAAVLVCASVAGLFLLRPSDRPKGDSVMLVPFDVAGNAPLARTLAGGVSADVNTALSAAGVDVIDAGASDHPKPAAFVLSGRAELAGPDLHLTAQLQDSADHAVLWSTSFTRSAGQMQALQEQVADNLAQVLHCALDTSRQPNGQQLSQDSIKLYIKACALEQAADPPSEQIEDLLRQVTVREPRFAAGWARLAFFAANAAFSATPADADRLRREASSAVQNALRLDPRSGVAYNAVAELELGHVPFAVLHSQFQKVLTFAPDDDFTINDECELLLRMGRADDSLRMCRRGVELEPLSPTQVSDLAIALTDDSRTAEAEETLNRALRIWPDDNRLRVARLDFEARFGDPAAALAILKDPAVRPQNVRDVTLEAYRQLAIARKARNPVQTRAFIEWLRRETSAGQLGVDFAGPHLADLGDIDGAFKLAFAAPADDLDIDPEFLWEPESLPLRRDPRFTALAAKFHVAAFWTSTGLWPDFCSRPNWPYSCKAQMARVASGGIRKA
jgi:DNA-binding winged helix-turn-helix (wHTH) protein/TolB-like protein